MIGLLSVGSPPRVREKLQKDLTEKGVDRITPACAGKTMIRFSARYLLEDHPRVCGKNVENLALLIHRGGSPPRVREKRFILNNQVSDIRITPACAGKTLQFHL